MQLAKRNDRTEVHLEELSAIVHEKEHQRLTLGPSEFRILNESSLKCATDQSPVISLKASKNTSVSEKSYT